jgi:hypothetical protein
MFRDNMELLHTLKAHRAKFVWPDPSKYSTDAYTLAMYRANLQYAQLEMAIQGLRRISERRADEERDDR